MLFIITTHDIIQNTQRMINGKADGIEVGLYVFSLLHYAVGVDLAVLFCVEWRKPS